MHIENIIIKIKTQFLNSVRNLINEIILYEEKSNNGKRGVFFVKLNKAITGQIDVRRTRQYLFNKTVRELFYDLEINGKFSQRDQSKNKKVIEYLRVKNRTFSNQFLDLKLIYLYNLYINDKKPVLEGVADEGVNLILRRFVTLSEGCKKMLEQRKGIDEKYIEFFKRFARNKFVDYYMLTKGRAKRKEKNVVENLEGKEV